MSTNESEILAQLRISPPHITVVGDVILDQWIRGDVRRLSREAPVPVVDTSEVEQYAGGAANTAVNLAAMGAKVQLVSAVSDDVEGRSVLSMLTDAGVDTTKVQVRSNGTTATKTRIVGEDQILVRVDRAATPALSKEERSQVEHHIAGLRTGETLLICDYGGGLFDDGSPNSLSNLRRPPFLILDAHNLKRWAPLHPDVITPNAREAGALLLGELPINNRSQAIENGASAILSSSGAKSAVVTLDVEGVRVLESTGVTGRTFAHPVAEHQASGAGDTFAAALSIALTLGNSLPRSAEFAQSAADIVVARRGTAICSYSDLATKVAAPTGKLLTFQELNERIDHERRHNHRVVFTNGCFDLIHRGHTMHLQQAKALGDVLVVALNDDNSVRRLKGPGRPVNTLAERASVLEALGSVDYVTSFSEDSPTQLLLKLRPEVYAKGGDYTRESLAETEIVHQYGGEVRILDLLPSQSTTEIVNRIARSSSIGHNQSGPS